MSAALAHLLFSTAAALLFIAVNRAVGTRVSARVKFLACWILAVMFLVPLKLPFLRSALPSRLAYSGKPL
jgi:hypothetical protein